MAVVAFDVAETEEYTLKADTENPTIWTIGRIDHRLWSTLQDKHSRMEVNRQGESETQGTVKFDMAARLDDFVRFGVKGWRNFADKNGKEIQFATQSHGTPAGPRPGLTDRLLEQLRPYLTELGGRVEEFNTVKKEEAKN
jgi:hypothetical protein